ncbi:FUSC family protein [Aliivibrio sifiae]|uniref:FUSC family protein n=1 Tax=Aliivibrio sifiae TaxID=566293 RepID=A0A2S7X6G1_9GAMM|nr:FUSC family protein [Aliivibrio sifiae]PQJ86930.1 FUSC family protein [Aliivibrio sifiae]GLR73947.1 fusaric acid resistance protein [Aliivibrio sifiae]
MLNASTKEAIKAALAVTLALYLAMWFQLEKSYWAATTVAVMALNETFAHSLQKGRNRVFGAIFGIGYALFLLSVFPQDRFLFIAFYTLFLGLSLFMSSNEKLGYIFVQGFTVCTVICCMGGFNSDYTFYYMVLRIQETALGIMVFTLVYKLVWPITTQTVFIQQYIKLRDTLSLALEKFEDGTLSSDDIKHIRQSENKPHQFLLLPNKDSYELLFYKKKWLERLYEIKIIAYLLENSKANSDELMKYLPYIKHNLSVFCTTKPPQPLLPLSLLESTKHCVTHHPRSYHRTLKQHIQDDSLKVAQGVSMFIASILFWIYLPIPGGFIFPMLAGILAANLPQLPPSVIKDAFWGTIGFGCFYLMQFVFILPSFTEIWQLASFYLINVFAIWMLFKSPRMVIFRVLSVNLLLTFTSGALNLTPSYNISIPLMMMVYLLLVLMIAKLFASLFNPRVSYGLPH